MKEFEIENKTGITRSVRYVDKQEVLESSTSLVLKSENASRVV